MKLSAFALASSASAFVATNESNMNGEYYVSQTPGGSATQSKFPTHFRDYPRGVQFFDVYSPEVSTLYSQVFWKGLEPVALPEEVVKSYAGKAMAIVGFELDQVMTLESGEEFSVPYNVAYNHHFESTVVGAGAVHEKLTLTGEDDPRIQEFGLDRNSCGHSMSVAPGAERWVVRETSGSSRSSGLPTNQAFGAANGGEARKSFHGYAPGFAQVIESPEKIQITPMQIDTWHREKMNITARSPFVAGPLPRSSLAAEDAVYSGLLECPVTTRIRKVIDGDYSALLQDNCDTSIETAPECFDAAAKSLSLLPHGLEVRNKTVEQPELAKACSVATDEAGAVTVTFNRASGSDCGTGTRRAGVTQSLVKVNVSLDLKADQASITLTGPGDVWFGVGFNASAMADGPWAVVVDGAGKVTERKLADQNPGKELEASVKVESSTLDSGLRTVVLTRALKGKTSEHLSFDALEPVVLPFINAIGSQATLSYHKEKTPSTLALLPVDGPGACICPESPKAFGQGQGTLNYVPVDQPGEQGAPTSIRFDNKCEPFPRMDLLEPQNPTCDVRSYVGGQIACHHMFSLLDADQEIPWVDQPLKYKLKFRFWYQDFDAAYHSQILRTTWGIGSPVEYDVPKCAEDVHGCSKDENGDWIHTISGTFDATGSGAVKLAAAHFHCHAPTCRSVQLYKNWNGSHGDLLCEERPIFGGKGASEPQFDEDQFILQPPCLWGSKDFGLEPPPDVTKQQLHAIKTSYANSGHHGEMAWLQTYYVNEVVGEAVEELLV